MAVKPKSKMVEKCSTKKSFTILPISVGTNLPLSEPTFSTNNFSFTTPAFNFNSVYSLSMPSIEPFTIYSLRCIVEIVGA